MPANLRQTDSLQNVLQNVEQIPSEAASSGITLEFEGIEGLPFFTNINTIALDTNIDTYR